MARLNDWLEMISLAKNSQPSKGKATEIGGRNPEARAF